MTGPELSVYITEFEKDPHPPSKKCTKIEGGWRCHLLGGVRSGGIETKRKVKFAVWGMQRPETGFLAPLISLLSACFAVRRDLKGEGSILASTSPTGHARAYVQTL